MTPEQREMARHALGLPNKKRQSYRNHYVLDAGCSEHDAWLSMVESGDAKRRANIVIFGGMDQFHLTRQGAEAALDLRERLCPEDWP